MKRKNHLLFLLLMMMLLALPMTTSAKTTTLSKSKTKVVLVKGEKVTLKVSGSKKADWKIGSAKFAVVTKKLQILANKKGSTDITAKVSGKTYKCTVKVENPSLNKTSVSLDVKDTVKLSLNGTTQKVTWKSSNTSIAKVSSSGKVTAVAPGTAQITAKVSDTTFTCKVTVKAYPITSVSLNQTTAALNVGATLTLKATYQPKNTTESTAVTWTSSNTSVATVSKGKVKAIAAGTAIITAKIGSKSAACTVTVKEVDPAAKLVNYIQKNGKTGNNGHKFISLNKTSGTTSITYSIYYISASEIQFIVQSRTGSKNSMETMKLDPSSANVPVSVTYTDNTDTTAIKSYQASAALNKATYNGAATFTITQNSGYESSEFAQLSTNCNKLLIMAFNNGWKTLIKKAGLTSMKDLGFTSYTR